MCLKLLKWDFYVKGHLKGQKVGLKRMFNTWHLFTTLI